MKLSEGEQILRQRLQQMLPQLSPQTNRSSPAWRRVPVRRMYEIRREAGRKRPPGEDFYVASAPNMWPRHRRKTAATRGSPTGCVLDKLSGLPIPFLHLLKLNTKHPGFGHPRWTLSSSAGPGGCRVWLTTMGSSGTSIPLHDTFHHQLPADSACSDECRSESLRSGSIWSQSTDVGYAFRHVPFSAPSPKKVGAKIIR
jgi:hypothetical protein